VKTPAARSGGQDAGGEYDGESGAASLTVNDKKKWGGNLQLPLDAWYPRECGVSESGKLSKTESEGVDEASV